MSETVRRLRIGELSRRTGVGRGTIQHYLREGLLPSPVKTHRNMAYYDPACVDRIRAIKELQERTFLPLSEIRRVLELEGDAGLAKVLVEAQRGTVESVSPSARSRGLGGGDVTRELGLPAALLDELAALRLANPREGVYSGADLEVLEAIASLGAHGFTEGKGFRAQEMLMYREAMEALLEREVGVFVSHLGAGGAADRAPELARAAVENATRLLVAIRKKMILDFLRRVGAEDLARGGDGEREGRTT